MISTRLESDAIDAESCLLQVNKSLRSRSSVSAPLLTSDSWKLGTWAVDLRTYAHVDFHFGEILLSHIQHVVSVHAHTRTAAPSTSPSLSAADSPASSQQLDEDHAMTVSEASSAPSSARLEADAALGPFLGTGANLDFNALMGLNREDELAGLVDLDWDSVSSGFSRAGSPGASGSGRRRVRIALRSMPGKGREGGEWEVEVC